MIWFKRLGLAVILITGVLFINPKLAVVYNSVLAFVLSISLVPGETQLYKYLKEIISLLKEKEDED